MNIILFLSISVSFHVLHLPVKSVPFTASQMREREKTTERKRVDTEEQEEEGK
jgi:hypothetical protein